MKIAYILPSLANRGPIKVVYNLVKELYCRKDVSIDIYYFDEITEIKFPVNTYKINFFTKIIFNQYDIIHSHGIRPDAYVWYNRKYINAKCVTTLHSYIREDLKFQYNFIISFMFTPIWNFLISKHDKVVVLSEDAKKYYEKFLINKNITFIYNGLDLEFNSSQMIESNVIKIVNECRNNKKIIIGAIGLLTKRKGFDQLMFASSKNPNFCLFIIGDGKEMKNLVNLSNKLSIKDRVFFIGYKKDPTIYFDVFDIIAIPSRSEGFPLILLEAAGFQKSVVCSDIPVFREVLSDNEVSFFKLDDIESLLTAIENAITYKEIYATNLYNKFIEKYTSKVMAEKYLNLYNELING